MSICMRVFQRIECNTCGYPASEAQYVLRNDKAVEPFSGRVLCEDPGCPYEREDVDLTDLGEYFRETAAEAIDIEEAFL